MMLPRANFHLSMLTKREQEILRLIACGMSSLTIATALGISIHTVRQHRTNMRRKMDMRLSHVNFFNKVDKAYRRRPED